MLHGLRSFISGVPDLAAAKAWYAAILGKQPYFDEPFYVGFDCGGYELGLLPADSANSTTYWAVDDAHAALDQLVERGAAVLEAAHEVGDGIVLGSARDPHGVVIGVIVNPHFKGA
jgi:predicted enzyme related to lactoylglutathione lyase